MCLRGAKVKSRVQVLLTQCWTYTECSPFFHPDPTGPRGSPSPSCQSSALRRAQWHGPLMKQETGPPGKRAEGTQRRPQKTTKSLGLSGKGACYHIYMHDSFWRLLYPSGCAKYYRVTRPVYTNMSVMQITLHTSQILFFTNGQRETISLNASIYCYQRRLLFACF